VEDPFWRGLKDIAASRQMRLADLVDSIGARPGVSQNAARAISLPRLAQPILGRGYDDRNGVDLCQVEN